MFSEKSLLYTIGEHLSMNHPNPQDEYYFGFWLYARGWNYQRNITEDEFTQLWMEYCKTGYQPKVTGPGKTITFLLIAGPLVGLVCGVAGFIYYLLESLP